MDDASAVTVLTGAGISTESGNPDYRGPTGVWTRNPDAMRTVTLQDYVADAAVRRRAPQARPPRLLPGPVLCGSGDRVRCSPQYRPAMEQRVSLITLGVGHVQRARAFYERLGWQGQEVEETVFLQAGGVGIVLWSREKLALDCGIADRQGGGFGGIALAHNVRSRAEVDEVMAAAEQAGAVVTRPAALTFYGGYAGVFTDPDGHPWEIAHNPRWALDETGAVHLTP